MVRASVPVKFLKNWIQSHYADDLLQCCAAEFNGVERVDVALRQPGFANGRASEAAGAGVGARQDGAGPSRSPPRPGASQVQPGSGRDDGAHHVNGFEGSPLDPRYTFDSFVVGPSNRMAHAAATQVAETVLAEERGFNPLYLHSASGSARRISCTPSPGR